MKYLIIALFLLIHFGEQGQVLIRATYYLDDNGTAKIMFENYTKNLNHDKAIDLMIDELKNINPIKKRL